MTGVQTCALPISLAARCHLGLGMLYRATGQPESAQHHLATAATMFRDMAMRSWLEKATAEMDEGSRDTA